MKTNFSKEFETNRATWNEKTQHHYEGAFYDKAHFSQHQDSLQPYELEALGSVEGKSLLHLQCHFGQDTLSWAKRGAKVTGVDISDAAIHQAKALSTELRIPATFHRCNVLDTSSYVKEVFDIVYTSYGVIGWLPDLKPWAQMIAERLKPGGVFYIVEFHPIAWMYDYTVSPPVLKYHYNRSEAIYEEYPGTYGAEDAAMTSKEYGWNHALSEVVQALIGAGLAIKNFAEHDGSPYNIFPELEHRDDGLYYLKDGLYPLVFEIMAEKPQ